MILNTYLPYSKTQLLCFKSTNCKLNVQLVQTKCPVSAAQKLDNNFFLINKIIKIMIFYSKIIF